MIEEKGMQRGFFCPLEELSSFCETKDAIRDGKGPVLASGCYESQKVHLLSSLYEEEKEKFPWQLIVTYSEKRAAEIIDDYGMFSRNVYEYPPKDFIFYSADLAGKSIGIRRLSVLKHLAEDDGGIIVATIDGLMNRMPPFPSLLARRIHLEEGGKSSLKGLSAALADAGYEAASTVTQPGEFAIRGGILDVFSMTEENPWRIEFFDDEVDSIRIFDPETQRSVERVPEISIFPASELVYDERKKTDAIASIWADFKKRERTFKKEQKDEESARLSENVRSVTEELENGIRSGGIESYLPFFYPDAESVLSCFPKGKTMICLDEPARLKERADEVEKEFRESMEHRFDKGALLPGQMNVLIGTNEIFSGLAAGQTILLSGLEQKFALLPPKIHIPFQARSADSYANHADLLMRDLKQYSKEHWRIVLLCPSKTRAERLAQDLTDSGLHAFFAEEPREIVPGTICVMKGSLHRGFLYPQISFAVLDEQDMFGAKKKTRTHKTDIKGTGIFGTDDLSVGDYVVHEVHGIGIYRGIFKMESDHMMRDYMKIEYGDGGNLYVPVTNSDMIQKYADAGSKPPRLNRLGSPEWKKTKKKVKQAVDEVAEELVNLYAVRQEGKGYAYGPDTVWQKEFEEMFPYEETRDQLAAIEATKKDMESTKIMDRLICGDVGFGKTEVAIRAAFKAVQEGKQVAYLVPTTILAEQHFNTFRQRMKDYPIRIEMLSRFCSSAEIRETIEGLKNGTVDIVIGTHRLLSKDVAFRDLGLLVIDEEQRFGVNHKERIKQMKQNVDVLSLSATPIPRTLEMSLTGIRDMSLLTEPPRDRQPIQTYVMEWDPEMVRDAVRRELARGGQVYYVYNRISDIGEVAAAVQKLVPEAVVRFAHGQMSERELERVMMDFINREIDVLVSTTIIETGLDISNVNTIIIHDADRYGLAQLYQLRGRVGRSSRTAYAFIMVRRDKVLKEEAEKRLSAIRDYTELGSGIRIAMKDLEIRGAGNLLGEKQHGHMEAVGYDLYCKMLNEAVSKLRGEPVTDDEFETSVDLPLDAFIPSDYIRNESQKLQMYRRISAIRSKEDREDLFDELTDRYGDPPKPVENLLLAASIRAQAHEVYITDLSGNEKSFSMKFEKKAPFCTDNIGELLGKYPGRLFVSTGEVPSFTFHPGQKKKKELSLEEAVTDLENLFADIKTLLIGEKSGII